MRDCHQCGEPNQANARFCVVCGVPLAEGAPPAAADPAGNGTGRPHPGGAVVTPEPPPGVALEIPPGAPPVLVGFLVSFDHVELGQYWPLHQGKNTLGRQGAAAGLDIEISHPTTSSLHAVLLAGTRPSRVIVEDNRSTNGTFVNDNPLAPGQRWELRDGDRVRFGLFKTLLKIIEP